MKTLYESILDDEDILINQVKQQANDPFLVLKSFRGKNLMKYNDKIINALEVFPLPKSSKLKNINYTFDIDNQNKKIYIRIRDNKIDLSDVVCAITMDPTHSVYVDDRDIMIMYFNERYFSTNSMKFYSKKWNLNPYYDGEYSVLYI